MTRQWERKEIRMIGGGVVHGPPVMQPHRHHRDFSCGVVETMIEAGFSRMPLGGQRDSVTGEVIEQGLYKITDVQVFLSPTGLFSRVEFTELEQP